MTLALVLLCPRTFMQWNMEEDVRMFWKWLAPALRVEVCHQRVIRAETGRHFSSLHSARYRLVPSKASLPAKGRLFARRVIRQRPSQSLLHEQEGSHPSDPATAYIPAGQ